MATEGLPPLGEARPVKAEPKWANIQFPPIDYQDLILLFGAKEKTDGLKSLEEVDPKLLETYEKLGIPLAEQKWLTGVAVDAVFDSVSVATTFKEKLGTLGVNFCSFSEAVNKHAILVKSILGPWCHTPIISSPPFIPPCLAMVPSVTSQRCALSAGALNLLSYQCR